MNWEETIMYIRTQPEYRFLVDKAYFEEDLSLNVDRFKNSKEFNETLSLMRHYAPKAKTILDVGSGNGISAIAFALNGYEVTVSEPDPSMTVGAGAVRKLKSMYQINTMEVYEQFAEDIKFNGKLFDVVYIRQAMHHAYDLQKFILNLTHLLKPGGFLFTIRDHVIYDEKDKQWFLENHPLQKFYGGENAFTLAQYTQAMKDANLEMVKVLRHYESVINYFPENLKANDQGLMKSLRKKIGYLSRSSFIQKLYQRYHHFSPAKPLDERLIPGRMYSFIAKKQI